MENLKATLSNYELQNSNSPVTFQSSLLFKYLLYMIPCEMKSEYIWVTAIVH